MANRQSGQHRSARPETQSEGKNKTLRWAFGGAILGVIGTFALVISQLTTIANAVQYFFPSLGPFDAAITIASPSVKGEPRLDGGIVELHVEFIEYTTGRSTLTQCRSEIQLAQDKYESTSQPVERPSNSQQIVEDAFRVPLKQYGGQASLWRQCIKRVALPVSFNLPAIPNTAQQQTTYVVCIGEYPNACRGNATWLPCGTNASRWAQNAHPSECKKVAENTLSDVSGNRCGYATVQVTCSQ
jgi:hypothetical protein